MKLSKQNLSLVKASIDLDVPPVDLFDLPEKVLQFGTGVLLRGLPDYFIDKANKEGVFNGRVVVVKSTSQGTSDAFSEQDGLYTQCVRGYNSGSVIDRYILNAAISRVISAKDNWDEILAFAESKDLQVVISNTTEAGLVLVNDNITASPPVSFPGKLLAFLHRRYEYFNGVNDAGLVILPTELITDNGDKLKDILLSLADQNKLDDPFKSWLIQANDFCSTLVDRIVPGALSTEEKAATEKKLGYEDDLLIMSEVYSLWAIQTSSESVIEKLSFAAADNSVVITADISKFKELKLRLLNGSHTFCCGLAILRGFATVKEAMTNDRFFAFISKLMFDEIVPSVVSDDISGTDASDFARIVLDRYRNPFIEHKWLGITLQYTMKMQLRNVELILRFFEKFGMVPLHMAKGFAAYILFMQSSETDNGIYMGIANGIAYKINDEHAKKLSNKWQEFEGLALVENILSDTSLWKADLSKLPGFAAAVHNGMLALQIQ